MTDELVNEVAKHLLPNPPLRIGVAVSGGGDSVALLHLLLTLAKKSQFTVCAVTVDHGLRPESAEEARKVGELCQELELQHDILRWEDWDGQGNLMAEARDARYRLIADWAHDKNIQTVALGHSEDDQAETVLMRLARGAGVDGLSAMSLRKTHLGVNWIRPVLQISREDLRDYLRRKGLPWCDDPSNDDHRFERIRARSAMKALEPLGITAKALTQVAENMVLARSALNWNAFLEARRMIQMDAGALVIEWKPYRTLPDEIARRILIAAIGWVSRSTYPPRRATVLRLIESLKAGNGGTVDGCQVRRFEGVVWIFREHNAVRDTVCEPGNLWDGRWRLTGPLSQKDLMIRALGQHGLLQCEDWRTTGRPHAMLQGTPAVWDGDTVVAAPLANFRGSWHAEVDGGVETFFAALLSH